MSLFIAILILALNGGHWILYILAVVLYSIKWLVRLGFEHNASVRNKALIKALQACSEILVRRAQL